MSEPTSARVAEMSQVADTAIHCVQRIATGLRPAVLDSLRAPIEAGPTGQNRRGRGRCCHLRSRGRRRQHGKSSTARRAEQ